MGDPSHTKADKNCSVLRSKYCHVKFDLLFSTGQFINEGKGDYCGLIFILRLLSFNLRQFGNLCVSHIMQSFR